MRIKASIAIGFSVALAACQTPVENGATDSKVEASGMETQGEHLAVTLCSGCHAVADGEISPNAEAPDFVSIANREGLTRQTLGNFLHDSYNFPNQMNLELSDEDADKISAYILTLREP
ncbi:c-type cytochrome [Pontixanthobacter aestiaquae]|uniref:Cytochrome c domain-containing protein n=1 Tax=Pontixanthobacter aestiaquae TaxID=1509367 RepID=A0A844ZBM3_9SPHN|nr:c-type cytochrome [Pontixanthobacter aestiaquae]MDN3645766.1 c-type cytochrome [Pontixanthobacter aestiaquae]MXO83239.1 hypothetical protein [Pontixanthobacter aestiaquae]